MDILDAVKHPTFRDWTFFDISCVGSMPLLRDQDYTWFRLMDGAMATIETLLMPWIDRNRFINETVHSGVSMPVCFVTDCDTVAVSFLPAVIPILPTGTMGLMFLAGIGASLKGNLALNLTDLAVWDGMYVERFVPQGNFWLQVSWYISAISSYQIAPFGEIVRVSPMISFFAGKGMLPPTDCFDSVSHQM
jgi:hypothetical protein